MKIPRDARDCVVFIGRREIRGDGSEYIRWCGTGFFVSIPLKEELDLPRFIYLVTAKHVAERFEGRTMFVRLNTKDSGSVVVKIEGSYWHHHPIDKSVDVAVHPVVIQDQNIEFRHVTRKHFAIKENLEVQSTDVGIGDDVFIVGLFVRHHGQKRNVPIARVGNIAAMPDKSELIKAEHGDMEGYLIEARSIGGLSGSPVFLYSTPTIGTWRIHLLGLVHGHWDIPKESEMDLLDEDFNGTGKLNTGIAVVVPAEHILETIDNPALVAIRTSSLAEYEASQPTTADVSK